MKKVFLCILDGMGLRKESNGNAFLNANTPTFDYLWNNYPHSTLNASEEYVGLPKGQMGNSEVGHMNIGTGRIIYQPLELINRSISSGEFYSNKSILEVINHVKKNNSKLHIMGLLSDGGVHSHINHLFALMDLCKKENMTNVYYDFFMDGRDTSPTSGKKYLTMVEEKIKELGFGSINTISGRYYSMDRDNRFDRIKRAYDAIVFSKGNKYFSAIEAWEDNQERNITDEFIEPSVIDETGKLNSNDGIILFNFRPDRARELFACFTNSDFSSFDREPISNLKLVTMMEVSSDVICTNAYNLEHVSNTLGEVISDNNLKQLRIAETEKYAHVTYFFDGGVEKELNLSKRILIPSKKVPTYDMDPSMSANEITDALFKEINENHEDLIVLNFANGDMVGHTGNYNAAVSAVQAVDSCLNKIVNSPLFSEYIMLICADHGNCEMMINEDGSVNTSHTTNKVPFIITNKDYTVKDGNLSDIAPTILKIMDISIPSDMKGNILI